LVPIGKAAETIRSLGHAVSQAPAPLTDFSKGIATIEADRQSIGRQAFEVVDVLILPTTAAATPRIKDAEKTLKRFRHN
jgi:Asp-tRNA(Asn)/Glu-tRNA(Gln) amidotransferase A subunit family amidase